MSQPNTGLSISPSKKTSRPNVFSGSRKKLAVALLAFASPFVVHAADLSMFSSSFNMFDPNDPTAGVLAMEEIDVWERLRKGYAIPELDNPLVRAQIEWHVARPEHIQLTTKRASRYLFHVVQELEKRGMPTELALLPFIESAFNPEAYSSAKAAGIWQFIPSTGLHFNLKQNFFKDERRDVLASTDAALTYLQKLHAMFGDWHLALAAYNWGEGSVQRAINKNRAAGRPTDFNALSALMPAETRNYVPKLMAVKSIIGTPARYNIVLPEVDNQPYFVTIAKTRDIDINVAAELAEMSVEEFKSLNPQFNRPVITGGEQTKILLPENNAAKFKNNINNWTQSFSSWTAHTVRGARERIESIAARFDTTPEILRKVNNIPPKMQVAAGSTILVPRTDDAPEQDIAPELLNTATLAMVPEAPTTRRIMVKVRKRDSVASIAKRYQVSVADVREWNGLRADALKVGQSLRLNVPLKLASASKRISPRKTVAGNSAQRRKAEVASSPARKRAASKPVAKKAVAKSTSKRSTVVVAAGK